MNTRMIRAAAVFATLAVALQVRAAELTLPRDGWASWQVDAVEGAPSWCCLNSDRDASRASCNLDRDGGNFGTRDHSTTDAVRVYARLAGGKVDRLRVLSASCPVETAAPIQVINTATDDSTRWLIALLKRNIDTVTIEDLHENVLAALAMHRGDRAHNELVAIARGDGSVDTRQKVVFWLALVRGAAGAEVATDLMFNDKHAELRKHAAFAITQSKSPKITENLIRLGNTDKDGGVRAQAWFWLAHTGAANAESAITAALKKDGDEQVREQAIFALSRLPDERATRALIAAAEDRSLSHEQRKRAVFWLAQSQSKGAQAYLDKVFAGTR
jgi:hypothetical protein